MFRKIGIYVGYVAIGYSLIYAIILYYNDEYNSVEWNTNLLKIIIGVVFLGVLYYIKEKTFI